MEQIIFFVIAGIVGLIVLSLAMKFVFKITKISFIVISILLVVGTVAYLSGFFDGNVLGMNGQPTPPGKFPSSSSSAFPSQPCPRTGFPVFDGSRPRSYPK